MGNQLNFLSSNFHFLFEIEGELSGELGWIQRAFRCGLSRTLAPLLCHCFQPCPPEVSILPRQAFPVVANWQWLHICIPLSPKEEGFFLCFRVFRKVLRLIYKYCGGHKQMLVKVCRFSTIRWVSFEDLVYSTVVAVNNICTVFYVWNLLKSKSEMSSPSIHTMVTM
jgi:hypothetical protein